MLLWLKDVIDSLNHLMLLPFHFAARSGSRTLQSLTPEERAASVNTLADLLITKQSQILEANAKDLEEGTKSGLAKPLLSRLSLTPAKLKSLSTGLKQIADSSLQVCGRFMRTFMFRLTQSSRNYESTMRMRIFDQS